MSARMETASRLIHRARNAGGSLALHGGKVKALAVPAELLPDLRAHKAEVMALLTPPAPPAQTTINPRPALRFKLTNGGGTILGQSEDTAADLLADLRTRWPRELLAVWQGTEQIYPDRETAL